MRGMSYPRAPDGSLARERISYALEALLWIGVMGLSVVLVMDIGVAARAAVMLAYDCNPAYMCSHLTVERAQRLAQWPVWSIIELSVLQGLVWWPMIRCRIRYGYWMRDWEDHPARHFREQGDPRFRP